MHAIVHTGGRLEAASESRGRGKSVFFEGKEPSFNLAFIPKRWPQSTLERR